MVRTITEKQYAAASCPRTPRARCGCEQLSHRKAWRQTDLHRRKNGSFQSFKGLRADTLRHGRRLDIARPIAALTESAELPLGTVAPAFELLEPLTGRTVSSSEFKDAKALLVVFMCNHCPFVKLLKEAIVELAKSYKGKGVEVVAISANSIQTHPQDGPEKMAEDAQNQGYPFPYLYDETQEVAKQYQAACTPEFFVFDQGLKLQYHGQFDSARPSNEQPVTGEDVKRALDTLLAGGEPEVKVKPSIGCNIKWHPGNEPAYAQ